MLLDEWSEEDLELARSIGAGRRTDRSGRAGGTATSLQAGATEALDELMEDPFSDALSDPLAGMATRDGADRGGHRSEDGLTADSRWYGARPGEDRPEDGFGQQDHEGDDTTLTLHLKSTGGDGLLMALWIDGERARAWVDAQAWCEWIAPRLAVQRPQQIPPDLMPLLGEWTLLPLERHASMAGLAQPRFAGVEPGAVNVALAPTLSLERGDATLDMRLIDWPQRWVAALADTMDDRRPPSTVPPLDVALAAGWLRLRRTQLAALRPGDGLVLEQPASVETGRAWLVAERAVAMLRFEDGRWGVEDLYEGDTAMESLTEASLQGEALTDDSIVLTAVAEVGRLSLPLDTLQGLQRGQVLELAHARHGKVTLTVSGRAVARGTLLRVGDKLVMRIE